MALSQSSLKTKLVVELTSAINITDASQLDTVCNAIAAAIVQEITANAQVLTTGVTGAGTPGGPLPIVAQPGVVL